MALYFGVKLFNTVLAVTLRKGGSACISLTNMKAFALFANCQHAYVVQLEGPPLA